MTTVSREIIVSNKLGLHARPAMQFVDVANRFAASVEVVRQAGGEHPETRADGKSVMQMLTLEATAGTPLTIRADGEDAELAVGALAELFESRFGEDE